MHAHQLLSVSVLLFVDEHAYNGTPRSPSRDLSTSSHHCRRQVPFSLLSVDIDDWWSTRERVKRPAAEPMADRRKSDHWLETAAGRY